MSVVKLDAIGLRCPQPVLKIATISTEMQPGDILEVVGDCLTFERDVRAWCERLKKTILFLSDEGNGRIRCQILF